MPSMNVICGGESYSYCSCEMIITCHFGRELIHKVIFVGLFMNFVGKTQINIAI